MPTRGKSKGKEPKEDEEEEYSDSFYALLMKADRKKSNGSSDISEEEFTPSEMKNRVKNWVGKKINLKHDRKAGFGKITAAWHTNDGKTYVRLSPGNSEAGKSAASKLKNGEITSVSAGWMAHKNAETKELVGKEEDHVALTNCPVYQGTVVYAMAASNDDLGISKDTNGVLRTRGGLAVLPIDGMPSAAIIVNKMVNSNTGIEIPSPHSIPDGGFISAPDPIGIETNIGGAVEESMSTEMTSSRLLWQSLLSPCDAKGEQHEKKREVNPESFSLPI